jgi:holo-[acyl-carrier protein] synthase
MSVVGIGTDIIDINRIIKMNDAVRAKLALRVLTSIELAQYQQLERLNSQRFLAKRWAAKEAAAKALGTGIAQGVSFQHIHISNLPSGQPQLAFSDIALTKASALGVHHCWLSIADEKDYATAFVVLSA